MNFEPNCTEVLVLLVPKTKDTIRDTLQIRVSTACAAAYKDSAEVEWQSFVGQFANRNMTCLCGNCQKVCAYHGDCELVLLP